MFKKHEGYLRPCPELTIQGACPSLLAARIYLDRNGLQEQRTSLTPLAQHQHQAQGVIAKGQGAVHAKF